LLYLPIETMMNTLKQTEHIIALLHQYLAGILNEAEQEALRSYVKDYPALNILLEELTDEDVLLEKLKDFENVYSDGKEATQQRMLEMINQRLQKPPVIKSIYSKWWPRWAAAAMILFALSFWGIKQYQHDTRAITDKRLQQAAKIYGGNNQAVLTLANGQSIRLLPDRKGIETQGKEVRYQDGTPLTSSEEWSDHYTLHTPIGAQYQLTLADGTRVWLNAASSITYPQQFQGKERQVTIEGEVYFEVAKNIEKPFIVCSEGQEIEVLGTSFNVKAYTDEKTTRTALFDGSVKIKHLGTNGKMIDALLLRPGYEAYLQDKKLTQQRTDLNEAKAWRQGNFYFADTPFDEMIKQLQRWYGIEVIYRNKIPVDTFRGGMSRTLDLLTVLDFLKGSDISFELVDKKLYIN